ncbi:RNA-binding (RRM/RBD/RNP motifs) family protein [Striga asiatica]|uniref:RNA-binding (RRM/RBD/RNP motifs) family protein n=1 Tax=Striga asiatica TaxID=4170 RepID=A0A5A7REI0_STRAF|nr:RNA-binding (RRM/RBD/RNP motifs) family protein [Striga asiatica]
MSDLGLGFLNPQFVPPQNEFLLHLLIDFPNLELGNSCNEFDIINSTKLDEEIFNHYSSVMLLPKSFDGKDQTKPTPIIRMRGLPYSAGKDDIIDFFKNFTLSDESVHIVLNFDGRPNGEAFVEFANVDDAKEALAKDRMTLGNRYVELFQSSLEELNEALSRGR